MTILADVAIALKDVSRHSSFVGFNVQDCRAVKRAARSWPIGTLGKAAAADVRPDTPNKDGEMSLSYGDDAYYIREAILGRHYKRGVHPV